MLHLTGRIYNRLLKNIGITIQSCKPRILLLFVGAKNIYEVLFTVPLEKY